MIKRNEIKNEDKWSVESIFKNDQEWQDEIKKLEKDLEVILKFKGKLDSSSKIIKELLETDISFSKRLDKIYLYAHMKNDEDLKNDVYKSFYDNAMNLYTKYMETTSWIIPELLKIENDKIKKFLKSDDLKPYDFYLTKILRQKEHILNENEEKILSMLANVFSTTYDSFKSINDCDFKFGYILDGSNNKLNITHGTYYLYLINKDRNIRKNAFCQYHKKYEEYTTTIASLLYGKIKEHVFEAKVRNFKDTLSAALFSNNIDTAVYMNLIKTVKENISILHEFIDYRKKKMKLEELHLYDMYVPFIETPDIKYSFDEAKKLLFDAVKPLGNEYSTILQNGIEKEKWVDKYENENKRSGAYSTGCYDSYPYILMNYNNTLNSVRTLAHEAGHSMHSYLSNKNQDFLYAKYPIFLAEVASTFNEELLNNYLINTTDNKKQIAYLLNSRLDEIRTTLFRQTMFAEFELFIHQSVENNIPLNYKLLNDEYIKLNKFYFGNEVIIDDEIAVEWARIPHFYYNYYVYQYATGISAAISLYKNVINESNNNKDQYINFLKSGGSEYPLDILNKAGVDMTASKPVSDAINYFKDLLYKLIEIED